MMKSINGVNISSSVCPQDMCLCLTEENVDQYLSEHSDYTKTFVANYLRTNPVFTEEYHLKFVPEMLLRKWYNMKLADRLKSKFDRNGNEILHEIQNNHFVDGNNNLPQQRRNSDPCKTNNMVQGFATTPTNSEAYIKRPRTMSNVDETDLEESEDLLKPSLRKAQSAPTCKTHHLSQLIRSSVYTGVHSTRHINVENRTQELNYFENHVMVDIMRDIAVDMNLKRTCFKVLLNYGFMLNIERASMYLVNEEPRGSFLKEQLHDISIDECVRRESLANPSLVENSITKGLVGNVAQTGQCFFSNNVENWDPLFDDEADSWFHDRVKNYLIQPIADQNNKTTAVIVATNNKSGAFTAEDKMIGVAFLSFGGACITNAKRFELTKEEFDRNKCLLELAHDVFEEQTSLANVKKKILDRATTMFKCRKSSLMLIEDPKETDEKKLFSQIFPTTSSDKQDCRFSKYRQESVTVPTDFDQYFSPLSIKDNLENTLVSSVKSYIHLDRGTLCIPLRNNIGQINGVIKLNNRIQDVPFTENDGKLLEGFAIFSGLGINNCIMYDKILEGQAQQKVAIEALSYHTNARQSDVDKLKTSKIASCQSLQLASFSFDDFSLLDHEMLTASIRMFMEFGFMNKYQIEYEVLCRFLITVKNNYRRVIYHNWRHAFNVTQSMFATLTTGKMSEKLSSKECLALLVGCLCHDLDHRGTNNEFQMKTDSPLVKLYGTSTMEHHHFNRAVMILNSEGNNIFSRLPSEDYRKLMKLIKHAILATDLSNYIRQRDTFETAVQGGVFDTNCPEHRSMLRSMLMTACDLNGITKPWEIQKRVVHLVTSEFFYQGDMERDQLNVEPMQMMDRKHVLQLPKLQVNFFQMMGIPVYKALSDFNCNLLPLLHGASENKRKWSEMNEKIEQGEISPDAEPVLRPLRPESDVF